MRATSQAAPSVRDAPQERPARRFFEAPWTGVLCLAVLYLAVTLLTRARFMGDTVEYVSEAGRFDGSDWDFGHLWWQPLGWALGHAAGPVLATFGHDDPGSRVLLVFLAVNWLAGLACVLLLAGVLRRLGAGPWSVVAAGVALLFSQAFLNYAHTGSSYVPGLACAMLALYLAVRTPAASWGGSLAAGAALGAAVCLWFPYVLVVPAVLLAPLLLGADRQRWGFGVRMGAAAALLLVLAYGAAALSLGITDVAGFRAWMGRSGHGVRTRGVARAAFGLARSFVYMGDDGLAFKRFLLHDPYNPVSLADLVRLSLWKLGLFYLALAALMAGLVRTPAGRRRLLLGLVAALPVVGFGVLWQGGDMERYLPLYPFLLLALAGLWSGTSGRLSRAVTAGFFALVVLVNGTALSRWEVGAYRDALKARADGLAGRLPPGSQVVVVRDRLKLLPRDFPLDADTRLPVTEAVIPGLDSTPQWRADFRALVERTWQADGEVWLSRRLLAPAPPADSTWAEGDDPRLKWQDVAAYFRELQTDESVGGDDGFVRLARSPENVARLALGGGRRDP
jgi:4-amino-4-deoxy-L-arabinose transferase-like glycosyltransferase